MRYVSLFIGLVLGWWLLAGGANNQPPTLQLTAPPALAQSAGFLQDEAGMAAYTHAGQPLNLEFVREAFKLVEYETEEYIIGVVSGYEVHVYAHRDGWIIAYYPAGDPIAKIVDGNGYTDGTSYVDNSAIPTKLEYALSIVLNTEFLTLDNLTFYHFQYPNATHLRFFMTSGKTFTIIIPPEFELYERGWVYYNDSFSFLEFSINGEIMQRGNKTAGFGILTDRQLRDGVENSITAPGDGSSLIFGGLVLLYREGS